MGEHEYLIAPNGRIFDLADYAMTVSGIGDMPTEYLSSRGYKQHGVTVRDWHLTPRTVSFAFDMTARSRSRLWDARARLIDTLRPNNGTGKVTYRRVMPSGARRDIQGRVQEPSFTEIDRRSVETGFSLFCEDPSFYDPKLKTIQFVANDEDGFVLPFALPDDLFFGPSPHIAATANNPGNWRAYPILTITGPYTRIVVANLTINVSFQLGGGGSATGDVIVVSLVPGQDTITHNGVLALDELEQGNLVDWYLESGDNEIDASGIGLSGDTSVKLEFYPRYIAL